MSTTSSSVLDRARSFRDRLAQQSASIAAASHRSPPITAPSPTPPLVGKAQPTQILTSIVDHSPAPSTTTSTATSFFPPGLTPPPGCLGSSPQPRTAVPPPPQYQPAIGDTTPSYHSAGDGSGTATPSYMSAQIPFSHSLAPPSSGSSYTSHHHHHLEAESHRKMEELALQQRRQLESMQTQFASQLAALASSFQPRPPPPPPPTPPSQPNSPSQTTLRTLEITKNAEISSLKFKIASLQTEVDVVSKVCEELHVEKWVVEVGLEAKEGRIRELQLELEVTRKELKEIERKLVEKEREWDDMTVDLGIEVDRMQREWKAEGKRPKTFKLFRDYEEEEAEEENGMSEEEKVGRAYDELKVSPRASDDELLAAATSRINDANVDFAYTLRGAFYAILTHRLETTIRPDSPLDDKLYLELSSILRTELSAYLTALSLPLQPALRLTATDDSGTTALLVKEKARTAKMDQRLGVVTRELASKVEEVKGLKMKVEALEKEGAGGGTRKANVLFEDLEKVKGEKNRLEVELERARREKERLEGEVEGLKMVQNGGVSAGEEKVKAQGEKSKTELEKTKAELQKTKKDLKDKEVALAAASAAAAAIPSPSTSSTSNTTAKPGPPGSAESKEFVIRKLTETVKTLSTQLTSRTAENAELMLRLVQYESGSSAQSQ